MNKFILALLAVAFSFVNVTNAQVKNIILVHGAFADQSGWEGVYKILTAKGYHVDVVSHSNLSLAQDVISVKTILAQETGPVILVGHSYGGQVISQAGDTANVAGLVYVSAFALDEGESLLSFQKNAPPNPEAGYLPPVNGLVYYDIAKYHRDFCPDLSAAKADFMAHAQTPLGIGGLVTPLTDPAWKKKPSWYVVTKDDRMIPPDAQRFMAKRANAKVTEIVGSHVGYISHPEEVAAVIEAAANGANSSTGNTTK